MTTPTDEQMEVMARHYVIAAIWADAPEGTRPRATATAHVRALEHCRAFCSRAGGLIAQAVAREGYGSHPDCGTVHPAFAALGHDLWLTRRGHGVGFWDRPELKSRGLGKALSYKAGDMGSPMFEFYRGWFYLHA